MQPEWILAFEGDVWRVKIVQNELDALGIDNMVPDAYVPMQDPHLSGMPTSASQLYVRAEDYDRARRVIAEHPAKS